ncbi:hypothetical protein [Arthrobacter sp. ZGTC131]|uniref:hypothetical protein n=1 Tax=Arthrobacter sp. ZGTC131 TaxID=2058898 RepID=UPI0011B02C5E|nr:hypothetical protein [Arthrobacter sp. ZGTC131]
MDVTVGNVGESRGLFRGMNAIWAILATVFLIGFGAMLIEFYIIHGDVLGRLEFANGAGFGVSGLLILGSAAAFLVARICQVVANLIMRRHRTQNPDIQ